VERDDPEYYPPRVARGPGHTDDAPLPR
jgi:hypothetical protein